MIIYGDSLLELKKINSNYVDLIFADPPYWMRTYGALNRVEGTIYNGCNDDWDQFNNLQEYLIFTQKWLKECYRILKPNGSIWLIGSMQCIYNIGHIMTQIGYWIINDVIWQKTNPTPNFKGTRLNNSHETLIWATKNKKSKYTFNYKTAKELNTDTVSNNDFQQGIRKQLGSVWKINVCNGKERIKNREGNKLHNTQKPEELLYRIIAISSKIGDLVLDPFGGTFTTAVIAKRLGRKYISIDISKEYCQYGKIRLQKEFFDNSNIANAIFDIKPIKVTFTDLIKENLIIPGELFYLKNSFLTPIGNIKLNGKILINNQEYDIHTAAAIAKQSKASRLNGFDYWFVKRNNSFISIKDIREQYRKNIKSIK